MTPKPKSKVLQIEVESALNNRDLAKVARQLLQAGADDGNQVIVVRQVYVFAVQPIKPARREKI